MFSVCEPAEEGIEVGRPMGSGKTDSNETKFFGAFCKIRNHHKTSVIPFLRLSL
jgi:hypothetical protein